MVVGWGKGLGLGRGWVWVVLRPMLVARVVPGLQLVQTTGLGP
jgi:hypothetical protein